MVFDKAFPMPISMNLCGLKVVSSSECMQLLMHARSGRFNAFPQAFGALRLDMAIADEH